MADKFDPYREALIVETNTVWSTDYDHLEADERARLEEGTVLSWNTYAC